jgi:hypothetical protein
MKVLKLDEIRGARIGDAVWKPIRSTLGLEAFGINAYVCEQSGATLFDEHDENEPGASEGRHQELYFVVTGRATFTVDGERIDAPAGTFVFVENPSSRRGAVAAEQGTTVLAMGGPVGEGYEVAGWEYWFRIRAAHQEGELDKARALADEALARWPDDRELSEALESLLK